QRCAYSKHLVMCCQGSGTASRTSLRYCSCESADCVSLRTDDELESPPYARLWPYGDVWSNHKGLSITFLGHAPFEGEIPEDGPPGPRIFDKLACKGHQDDGPGRHNHRRGKEWQRDRRNRTCRQ